MIRCLQVYRNIDKNVFFSIIQHRYKQSKTCIYVSGTNPVCRSKDIITTLRRVSLNSNFLISIFMIHHVCKFIAKSDKNISKISNELPVKRNVRITIIWIAAYNTTISRHVYYMLITVVCICTEKLRLQWTVWYTWCTW